MGTCAPGPITGATCWPWCGRKFGCERALRAGPGKTKIIAIGFPTLVCTSQTALTLHGGIRVYLNQTGVRTETHAEGNWNWDAGSRSQPQQIQVFPVGVNPTSAVPKDSGFHTENGGDNNIYLKIDKRNDINLTSVPIWKKLVHVPQFKASSLVKPKTQAGIYSIPVKHIPLSVQKDFIVCRQIEGVINHFLIA